MELRDYQLEAIGKMKNGCILNGGVGSGKSLTSLSYYHQLLVILGRIIFRFLSPMDSTKIKQNL